MSKPLLNNSSSVSTMTAVHFDDLPSNEGKIDMCIRYVHNKYDMNLDWHILDMS